MLHKSNIGLCDKVRYGFNIAPTTPVRQGTNCIPVPDTSAIEVYQFHYSALRHVRHNLDTGTRPTTLRVSLRIEVVNKASLTSTWLVRERMVTSGSNTELSHTVSYSRAVR